MNNSESSLVVSVIVPAYNESGKVREFIEAIESQSYPRSKIDLIIVDNGSTDDTFAQLKKYDLKLLKAPEKQSPYYARNVGFRAAEGDIIALLDMNKIPAQDWLQTAVEYFAKTGTDLLTGKIEFANSSNPTVYEVMDSIMYFNNEYLVKSSNACAAGNLLFKKEVLEEIGDFPELRSGMDMLWTKLATDKGFRLDYVEDVKVMIRPKKKKGLLKKSIRVGTGHPFMWSKDGVSVLKILLVTGKNFVPPFPGHLRKTIAKRRVNTHGISFGKLYLVFYFNQILVGIGRIIGLKEIFR